MSIRRFTVTELVSALRSVARRGNGDGLCWCAQEHSAIDNHHDIHCIMARVSIAMAERDLGTPNRKFVVVDQPWAYGLEIPDYYDACDVMHEDAMYDGNVRAFDSPESFYAAKEQHQEKLANLDI